MKLNNGEVQEQEDLLNNLKPNGDFLGGRRYLVPHTSLRCWDLSLGILLIGTLVTTRLIAINKQTELFTT